MLSRLSAVRRLPSTFTFRYYTNGNGRSEGSVAQSQGFRKKEKAHEDQYIQKHEQEQLNKLKASIEAKKRELEDLQNKAKDTEAELKEKKKE